MTAQIAPNQVPTFVAAIPTPTLGDGGSASVVYSTAIAASPTRCLEIMLDPSTYPKWNKFIPHVDVISASPASGSAIPTALAHLANKSNHLLPGAQFDFEVHMSASNIQKTELQVSILEEFERDGQKGLRVSWTTRGNTRLAPLIERVQEFLEDGKGGCQYTSYETFHGVVLTWAVKIFVGNQLLAGLTLWMNGLKAEAEASTTQ